MSSDLRKPLATLAEIGGENQARADKFQGEVAEANARASAFGSLIGGFGGLVSNLGGGKAYQRYQLALALSDGGQSLSGIGGGDQSLSGINFYRAIARHVVYAAKAGRRERQRLPGLLAHAEALSSKKSATLRKASM